MDEPERRTEEWTCTGVRMLNGKRAVSWLTERGRSLTFVERFRYVCGGLYGVEVADAADGHVTRYGEPRYRKPHPDAQLRAEWRAKEVAAEAGLATAARERSDAKADALDAAMEPLVAIARTMRTSAQREALAAHVIRLLAKEW